MGGCVASGWDLTLACAPFTPVVVELLGFHEHTHNWGCLAVALVVLMCKPATYRLYNLTTLGSLFYVKWLLALQAVFNGQ